MGAVEREGEPGTEKQKGEGEMGSDNRTDRAKRESEGSRARDRGKEGDNTHGVGGHEGRDTDRETLRGTETREKEEEKRKQAEPHRPSGQEGGTSERNERRRRRQRREREPRGRGRRAGESWRARGGRTHRQLS